MSLSFLALLPGLLALVWAFVKSPERALLDVVMPVVLLIPSHYYFVYVGLPEMNAQQAAFLGLAIAWVLQGCRGWKISRFDFWVVLIAAAAVVSEYRQGYASAALVMAIGGVSALVLPYLLIKVLVEPERMRVAFARRVVFLMAITVLPSLWEFRMGSNPFRFALGRFFPGDQEVWFQQMRWGFGRISGPYSHAILAGMIFAAGLLLNSWLVKRGFWETRFRMLPGLPFKKGQILGGLLLLGLFMTLSRGPWVGAAFGGVAVMAGISGNARRAMIVLALIVAIGGLGLTYFFFSYTESMDIANKEQENAVYRRLLFESYMPLIELGGAFGWGRTEAPFIGGQRSIDNHYLYTALTSGYIGLALFVGLLADALFSLLRLSLREFEGGDRILYMTMFGILLSYAVSLTSVYLGLQASLLYFMFIGWTDGIRLGARNPVEYRPVSELGRGARRPYEVFA